MAMNGRGWKTAAGALALSAVLAAPLAQAQDDGFGVGISVGEPTGLSFKGWLDNTRAIDVGLAWSFSENDSLQFHADYLIHDFNMLRPTELEGRMAVYYGLGARIKLSEDNDGRGRNRDDTLVGVRIPIGVTYHFPRSPVDLFGEFVPVLDLAPDTDFDLNLAIGARLYF